MRAKVTAGFAFAFALAVISPPAAAQPVSLSVIKADGQFISCLFGTQCALSPDDIFADIPVPGIQRKALLMSRTFVGAAGSPVEGRHAYQYRVDLKDAIPVGDSACVLNLTIDFGQVVKLRYNPLFPVGDVYQISQNVPQTQVGLLSAVQNRNLITFTFDRPICAGSGTNGDTSFFFGLASQGLPHGITAQVDAAGVDDLPVNATAPRHRP